MRPFYLPIFILLFFLSQTTVEVFADCNIVNTLRVGSRGAEVRCLQVKVGAVQDGIFGPLTRNAVMIYQSNHALVADGIVGPLTRRVLDGIIANNIIYPPQNTRLTPPIINNVVLPPKVLGVSPEKVRSGDVVKIYGENFSPNGNTVRLIFGLIEDRFDNLPSRDGKTISFVYKPPEVKTMNKEEILNSSYESVNKILSMIEKGGGSIDDIVAPYRNMNSEDDLRNFLNRNGHSFDEMYYKFYVKVENIYGQGSSDLVAIKGLRKLLFGSDALVAKEDYLYKKFLSLLDFFTPQKAYAQTPEGGTNSGIIMECTCGDGYLTTMVDFSSNSGSGLYWWSYSYVPDVGNPEIAGPQLGWFIKNGGICSIESGPSCYEQSANIVTSHWGEAP